MGLDTKVFGAGNGRMRRRPFLTALLVVLALLALVAVAHRPLLRAAGDALVVNEPGPPADAIVVVAGGTPSREARAAALFQAGGAPRVLVSRQFVPGRVQTLIEMGIRPLDFQGESVRVLEKLGVPRDAIVTLDQPVEITETELRQVVVAARARGWHRVTLVTSGPHTRRVRLIWRREAAGAIEAGIVGAPDECSSADGWWRRRRCSEAVLHEYLGLFALYLNVSSWMR
jgi:uncharacterized SAM-binding protein YcdF (DUF218 family)